MPPRPEAVIGILNINKPKNLTSHDVVHKVRKLLKIRRVGHCGTLDPMATGVLLICVGQATRLVEYLMHEHKCYKATVRFGQTTNTYDAEGDIVTSANPMTLQTVNQAQIANILGQFKGKIEQIPPIFSAIKKNGVPLYKLARCGQTIKVESRQVVIDDIEILSWHNPDLEIRVTCQAGTYIRSLAHDLGQALKVGAHLTQLEREQSGDWHVKDAISLETLAQAINQNDLEYVLHPMQMAIRNMPTLTISPEQARKIGMGQKIQSSIAEDITLIAACDRSGELVAILNNEPPNYLKPKKVFKPVN